MSEKYYTRRLLERLPKRMQSGPKMSALFDALDREMQIMARGTTLLMRSRWHSLARAWENDGQPLPLDQKKETELGQIALLFGLQPGPQENEKAFRRRMLEFIQIHRAGLGSASALLRLAALVYRTDDKPEITWKNGTASALFRVPRGDGQSVVIRLELKDNPLKTVEAVFHHVTPDAELVVTNNGLNKAMPGLELTPIESETAVPMLVHQESGILILFIGRIPYEQSSKKTLVLSNRKPPLIDGRWHNNIVLIGHGFRFDNPESCFYTPERPVRFASFGTELDFPLLVPGENRWTYCTLKPAELDYYLIGFENRQELRKLASEAPTPPVDLRLTWEEETPAAFTLRIPADYVPPFMKDMAELEQSLNHILEYGRAAGVKATLEAYLPFREQTLDPRDRLHPSLRFSSQDQLDLREEIVLPGERLRLREALDIRDRFGTSGVFDNAYLEHATFTPEKKPG